LFALSRAASALALAVLVLSGCASSKALFQSKIALKDVHFSVLEKANDNMPFSVDLVVVSDETLLPALLAMNAAQWFDPATNFRRDHPASLAIWPYELTPGLSKPVTDARFAQRRTRAVLLFANYKGKGPYRLRLDNVPVATVLFLEKTIKLAEQP
jgi:hypothetical protein